MHTNYEKRSLYGFSAVLLLATGAAFSCTDGRLLADPVDKGKAPRSPETTKSAVKAHVLSPEDKVVHVLSRLGYGPRPGDVEKVKAVGLAHYLELQLNPERVDDAALESKLAAFTELKRTPEELAQSYNTFLNASRQAQAQRKLLKKEQAPGAADTTTLPSQPISPSESASVSSPVPATGTPPAGSAAAAKRAARRARLAGASLSAAGLMPPGQTDAAREVEEAHNQFLEAKVMRAVESERQLQEVLVDFWSNHFNIDERRPPCGILKIADERDAIRPHIFGKFRDLLGASAKSPAMLIYLDNFLSTSDTMPQGPRRAGGGKRAKAAAAAAMAAAQPGAAPAGPPAGAVQPANKKRPGGLNENYAREIMELHTLGVDNGYTQDDVKEVARCFTGWSVASTEGERPLRIKYTEAGTFHFFPNRHDDGAKRVLGHVIPAGGGIKDGEAVLDILASQPATMQHISYQLCQRLVSDDPPQALIEKCTATWKRTDGDLREIVRTIVTSPEFFAPAAVRSKIKSPFEYAVSSVRALGGTCDTMASGSPRGRQREVRYLVKPPKGGGYLDLNTTTLAGQVGSMGQPLYQYQAPTGYPEDSRKWVSSGALISRLNFSLALTSGKIAGVTVPKPDPSTPSAGDAGRLIDHLSVQILHGSASPATRTTLLQQTGPAPAPGSADTLNAAKVAALLLGSPEFQRH